MLTLLPAGSLAKGVRPLVLRDEKQVIAVNPSHTRLILVLDDPPLGGVVFNATQTLTDILIQMKAKFPIQFFIEFFSFTILNSLS